METEQKLEIALKALREIAARRCIPRCYGAGRFDAGYNMGLAHQAEIADLTLMKLKDSVALPGDENDQEIYHKDGWDA